jgi:sugar phosphate isomerase/epimerase
LLSKTVRFAHLSAMHSTRRDFLRCVPALAAAGLVSPAFAADAPAPSFAQPSQLKLGLVTYNLAKDWDIETIIRNCAEAKFDGTELRTSHAHKVEVNLSAEQRATVRKRFADSPVQLMGLGSAFDYHTLDQAKLRADIQATKDYIVLAHDVGATGVKVRPNGFPKEVPKEKTLEQIGRSLRELGEFARGHGQVIRLEVHGPGTSLLPHIKTIMDVADHPSVGVCWNSNQSDLEGDGFDRNFDRVKAKIFSVHLRDLYLDEYPFHRLFTRLVASGFRGYTMAEIPESADGVRVMKYFRGLWLAYQGLL